MKMKMAKIAGALLLVVVALASCSQLLRGGRVENDMAQVLVNSPNGRAITDDEKANAQFEYYFNDKKSESNETSDYVGAKLHIRVDAFIDGKRIARGEDTIRVQQKTNYVTITLTENRESESTEQGTQQQPAIPYRELSTAQVGDVICTNGKVLSPSDITTELQSQTIAVVYEVGQNATGQNTAWAVGKILSANAMKWCLSTAQANTKNIPGVDSENPDGSTSLASLRAAVTDANGADLAKNYPAWDYACNYGTNQGLTSFQTGWYLPSADELETICYDAQKNKIEAALAQIGVSKTSFDNNRVNYLSSSRRLFDNDTYVIVLGVDRYVSEDDDNYVCAVRQFTY